MHHKNDNGLSYIQQYPQFKKWINTCICCGEKGYDPGMPHVLTTSWGQGEIETAGAANIRKYFKSIGVNELGICEECQKIQNRF